MSIPHELISPAVFSNIDIFYLQKYIVVDLIEQNIRIVDLTYVVANGSLLKLGRAVIFMFCFLIIFSNSAMQLELPVGTCIST